MIIYESAKLHPGRVFQVYGSVMPFSIAVALPCALLTVGVKLLTQSVDGEDARPVWEFLGIDQASSEKVASAAFSGVNFLIGFLVVFRSSQAYNRFWEGLSSINSMQGEWWDAASSLVAFCKCSMASVEEVILFQHTLMRLMSMLNGCVLMELSAGFNRDDFQAQDKTKRAFELELIDAEGIDSESLFCLNSQVEKVELIFQWIQQLVVENDVKDVFSVSGPVLSRAFQELSNGMVQYRQASKIARTPLPFPYMQATELLLISHWLCTPMLMCAWVDSALWAGILCFIQVMFYWSLNSIATELENPFGEDANDLPAKEIQQDFNRRLLLLLRPGTARTAKLSKEAAFEETRDAKEGKMNFGKKITLGKDGVNARKEEGGLKRRNSLELNRISWGTLQTTIEEKMQEGYESEAESREGGHSRSRTNSKTLRQPHVPPRIRSTEQVDIRRSSGSSKDVCFSPTNAGALLDRGNRLLAHHVDSERLSSQLASLPELLTVCMDVRDQLKAAALTEEVVAESRHQPPSMPTVREGVEASDVATESLMQPAPVLRAAGKPLGDGGCLGAGSCGRHSLV